jgi:hypothetical protein
MQSATRKIVVDTNNALKSPNISFHQATTLMSSEVAAFKPASTSANTDGAKDASDKTGPIKMEMKALVVGINKFAQVCVRSQPPTPAFTSCTTYSPAAPPASTIVTTLSSDSVSMEVGSKLSFIVTSSPSGTPWAEFHDQAAAAALATPQLVTLDPNRTQVTLSYVNAVKAETKVTLNLTTLGVPNNPKTIEITLKTVPAPTPAAVQVAGAAPAAVPPGGIIKVPEAEWSKLVKDKPELIKKLQLNNPTTADLIAQLNTKWRGLCGEDNKDENKLLRNEFLVEILADHQQSTPVSSYCKN